LYNIYPVEVLIDQSVVTFHILKDSKLIKTVPYIDILYKETKALF